MEVEDVQAWSEFKKDYNGHTLSTTDLKFLSKLHSKYYNHSYYVPCLCSSSNKELVKQWAKDIDDIHKRCI